LTASLSSSVTVLIDETRVYRLRVWNTRTTSRSEK
jgi:hypothetical protein